MRMENQEEILLLLERFTKSKQKDIPRELEDYLNFVARTGDTVYRWVLVKPLFREKLVNVITDFHDNTPSIADLPPCPNVDPFNYDRMKRALLERLDSFNSAPFTVQRICELLTEPRKQYTRIDKFMRAVEKNILVVSTQEPGRGRSDSENGDSLDSIVNGDLEVNVDIEMDNEHFHLEADALLPDSSDAVGGLHNALAEASHHPAADRADHELNGAGSFMNENNQFVRSETTAAPTGATENTPIIGLAAVVDTNENATDGDISTPLLESASEASSADNDTETEQPDATATEEGPVKSDEALPEEEALTGAKTEEEVCAKSSTATKETIATQEEEDATTTEAIEQSEAAKTPSEEPAIKQAVGHGKEEVQDSPERSQQQLTEDPSPAASKEGTEHEESHIDAQHAQHSEDGEPCAKIGKYELGEPEATEVVDVTVNSNTAISDATDSSGGSGADAPSSESSSSPSSSSSSSNDERFPVVTAKPQPSVEASEVKESEAPNETQPQHTEQQQPLSDILAKTIDPASGSGTSHPDQSAVEEDIAGKEAEDQQQQQQQQQQQLAVTSEETQPSVPTETTVAAVPILTEPTTTAEVVGSVMEATASVAGADVALVTTPAPVADQAAGEDEMELAVSSVPAGIATLPNPDNVMEEDVVPVADLEDDGTKMEDNVMDIDESSVEPMDQ
ncbi:serine/threonine-protein phosphatase 4 regulatory subunit 2 [Anopheles aquasalis]|uniref:serine/threonine-protein phosphatase 4 regulatory subunit 2 n=1 Tax=Anopheles aquasalis TaxID=42839 RepID=UPI00215B5D30|nr:serine/threonine-protein phosphatase 4 regulatory subunit 2 [Anopheles aquasalis]